MGSAPAELAAATSAAEAANGLPSGVLLGIWQREDGAYPNPYVNTSSYGGLFGLKQGQDGIDLTDPNTTQAQANAAGRILANLIRQTGSLPAALLAYSGGSYDSVPGVQVGDPGGSSTPVFTVPAVPDILKPLAVLFGIALAYEAVS